VRLSEIGGADVAWWIS